MNYYSIHHLEHHLLQHRVHTQFFLSTEFILNFQSSHCKAKWHEWVAEIVGKFWEKFL